MAKYKISGNGVQDTETTAYIPNDQGNRHWREYEVWLSEGNTPDPEFTEEELETQAWDALRGERDRLLTSTDFMMTYDYYNMMTEQEQNEVISYRQELRELPENTTDPNDVTWPTKPQIVIDNNI